MFHVLDHDDVVYTGELAQSTQYILERYGQKLDDAIRSGIKILCSDALRSLTDARSRTAGLASQNFWEPIEDWQID